MSAVGQYRWAGRHLSSCSPSHHSKGTAWPHCVFLSWAFPAMSAGQLCWAASSSKSMSLCGLPHPCSMSELPAGSPHCPVPSSQAQEKAQACHEFKSKLPTCFPAQPASAGCTDHQLGRLPHCALSKPSTSTPEQEQEREPVRGGHTGWGSPDSWHGNSQGYRYRLL